MLPCAACRLRQPSPEAPPNKRAPGNHEKQQGCPASMFSTGTHVAATLCLPFSAWSAQGANSTPLLPRLLNPDDRETDAQMCPSQNNSFSTHFNNRTWATTTLLLSVGAPEDGSTGHHALWPVLSRVADIVDV